MTTGSTTKDAKEPAEKIRNHLTDDQHSMFIPVNRHILADIARALEHPSPAPALAELRAKVKMMLALSVKAFADAGYIPDTTDMTFENGRAEAFKQVLAELDRITREEGKEKGQ